jgi:hypothetical protein
VVHTVQQKLKGVRLLTQTIKTAWDIKQLGKYLGL